MFGIHFRKCHQNKRDSSTEIFRETFHLKKFGLKAQFTLFSAQWWIFLCWPQQQPCMKVETTSPFLCPFFFFVNLGMTLPNQNTTPGVEEKCYKYELPPDPISPRTPASSYLPGRQPAFPAAAPPPLLSLIIYLGLQRWSERVSSDWRVSNWTHLAATSSILLVKKNGWRFYINPKFPKKKKKKSY